MRSRRHKLQVSTFPFLAVLLCAMGALLLVLLVMDRRAHDAARARAEQAVRRALEEQAGEAAARKTDLDHAQEAALAARRQARDAEHARLVSQETQVEGQIFSLREQLAQAVKRLHAEQEDIATVRKQTDAERAKAAAEEQALIQVRGEEAKKVGESESSRQALARMTADLAGLEQTLADLKAAREKDQKTYSVVPYNGKHGDSRRPLYVECAGSELIFYPDHLSLPDSRGPADVQAEVQKRLTRQKELLPAAQAATFSPYLMLLVRPDGVVTYYKLREALRSLKIDFGYEFIDKDWVLDFPADGQEAPPPSLMRVAQTPTPAATGPHVAGVSTGGGPDLPPAPPGPSVGSAAQSGASLSRPGSGLPGAAASNPQGVVLTPPGGRANGIANTDGNGPSPFGDTGAAAHDAGPPLAPGLPNLSGTANHGQASGPRGSAPGAPADAGAASGPPGATIAGNQGRPSDPGRTGPGASIDGKGISGALGAPIGGTHHGDGPAGPANALANKMDPAPWAPGAASSTALPPMGPKDTPNPTGATAPGAGSATPGAPTGAPAAPGATGTGAQGAGAPGANGNQTGNAPATNGDQAGAPTANGPQKGAAHGVSGDQTGGGDRSAADDFLQTPPPPLPKTTRPPAPLRPARLSGDRDWILYVECKPEGVVVYPTQLLVPASALARPTGSNPLLQSVQQLIDRKQATVRTGETPYRPEVRFLVHPDAGRTYHLAYPTLDTLTAPKTAQYLGPDDDVPTIVAH